MDPAKLKVTELRTELSKRGLDTKGNKAVLVERLRNALENETDDPGDGTAEIENEDVLSREKTPEPSKPVSPAKTPGRSSRSQASPKATPTRAGPKIVTSPGNQKITTTTSPSKSPISQSESSSLPEEKSSIEPVDDKINEEKATIIATPQTTTTVDEKIAEKEEEETPVIAAPQTTTVDEISSEPQTSESAAPQVAQEAPELPAPIEQESQQQVNEPEQKIESIPPQVVNEPLVTETTKTTTSTPSVEKEPKEIENEIIDDKIDQEQSDETEDLIDEDKLLADDDESENKEELESEKMETNDMPEENKKQELYSDKIQENNDDILNEKNDVDSDKVLSNDTTENEELKDEKMSTDIEEKIIDNNENCKIENEHDGNVDIEMKEDDIVKDDKEEKDVKDSDRKDRKDRKRKRSSSSQDERQKTPPPSTRPDDEPEIDYSRVLLSWYDSDLNLVIDKTKFLSATPMHNDGFGYVWAGARASYGFKSGKLYYEVKITHECNVTLQDEQDPHVLRAGWSVSNTSMQLGEEKLSFGYGGTGKTSTNLQFNDYGPKFGLNDILTCLIDFTHDDKVSMSYKLNGKDLGEAFSVSKIELDGKSLFPHILTKNCGFVCNFGDEEPWTEEIPDGFIPVSNIDINERVLGPKRPDKREDCQVLMMIGLPGAGKTTWAYKYAQDNPDKMYNILGTNMLIDKMKVSGLPRKKAYNVRWEILYPQCERCLITLLEVATLRRRNYIIDQTNVYPSAQRRKMRHFTGFQRKAILILPTDEEFKSRIAKRESVEGKDVPEDSVLKMKANFEAPSIGESFDAVEWIELGEEEGKKLIAKYNKEGKDAGHGQQQSNKRPRFEKSNDSHRDSRDVRSSRDSRDHRDRRNAYSDRNRSSTWRGGNQMSSSGGGGGGYRDRLPRGNHMRHGGGSNSSSGYGSSSGGWRGRGGQSNAPYRGNDRRGPSSSDRRSSANDRRVSSNRQGGWGPMNSNYHNSSSSNWSGSHGSGSGGGGWSAPSSQGNWSQSSAWTNSSGSAGGGSWGSWKGYGSNSQSNYGSSSYGNGGGGGGGWGSWNSQQQQQQQQQYYSQYWGQQSQGQSATLSGQTSSSGASTTAATSSSTGSTYNNYPQSWGNYSGSYSYSTDSSNPSSQK